MTFGVKTTSPETGFGYIETFDQISNNCEVSKIKRFIEKPTKDKAIQFFEDSLAQYRFNSLEQRLLICTATAMQLAKLYTTQLTV